MTAVAILAGANAYESVHSSSAWLGSLWGHCYTEWRRRFQTHGFEGLKDLPPIHKSHPQTTPAETVERIKALALEHPAFGCNRFEVTLVPVRAVSPAEEAALEHMIRERLKGAFRLRFRYVDAIPRGAGGKYEDFRCEIAG